MTALLDWLLRHGRGLGQVLRAGLLLALLAAAGGVVVEASLPQITTVRFTSQFRYLDNTALEANLEASLQGNYLTVDVAALRAQLLALPWVRAASVRKRWPDALEIDVLEHEPLARWNDADVISREGVLFSPPPDSIPDGLPRLRGAEPKPAAQALARLQPLLAANGGRVAELHWDARGALRLLPEGGPWLLLGRERLEERLARWLKVEPLLAREGLARPGRVDMRYANGLALAAGGTS
jgi:cell division protein FtsQ